MEISDLIRIETEEQQTEADKKMSEPISDEGYNQWLLSKNTESNVNDIEIVVPKGI